VPALRRARLNRHSRPQHDDTACQSNRRWFDIWRFQPGKLSRAEDDLSRRRQSLSRQDVPRRLSPASGCHQPRHLSMKPRQILLPGFAFRSEFQQRLVFGLFPDDEGN
ncbi:MAG TPA: hypothetical protein VN831_22120, partial [Bradyrhizobium sp.]|nr:hypothetical protein [Bradyrhizobium sp.]